MPEPLPFFERTREALPLQAADVTDQRLDLLVRQLPLERGHPALAVRNRVVDALVRRVRLPARVRQVARVFEFAFHGLRAPVLAVARGAVPGVGHGGVDRRGSPAATLPDARRRRGADRESERDGERRGLYGSLHPETSRAAVRPSGPSRAVRSSARGRSAWRGFARPRPRSAYAPCRRYVPAPTRAHARSPRCRRTGKRRRAAPATGARALCPRTSPRRRP